MEAFSADKLDPKVDNLINRVEQEDRFKVLRRVADGTISRTYSVEKMASLAIQGYPLTTSSDVG